MPKPLKQAQNPLFALAGWYGVLAILVAFGLVSFGLVTAQSVPYQLLNLTGAAGLVMDTFSEKDWQPALLNSIWMLVALISLIRLLV